jgi:AraC family transcriptional regulator, dual regulator of chb operon
MKKRWHILVPDGDAFHVSVALDEQRMPIAYHGHDFAEITWVVEGSGIHRVNGVRNTMEKGDLVFIRPQDQHALIASRETPFRLENIAFTKETLFHLRNRYFKQSIDWFWLNSKQPRMIRLEERQLVDLGKLTDKLRHAPRNAFHLDCFLLHFFRLLGAGNVQMPCLELPDWLAQGLRKFNGTESLRGGVYLLYKLAGRCPGHIARCMREHLGQTPSAWVNERRLEHAARMLESSNLTITEIAAECGFENLSYFHRLFQRKYGMSPLKYRKHQHKVM